MTLLGETGLRKLAALNHQKAQGLKAALSDVKGVEVLTPRFFNEMAVRVPGDAAALVEALAGKGVLAGVPVSRLAAGQGFDDVILMAATETTTDADIAALTAALSGEIS